MNAKKIFQPVGFFGVGAVIAMLFAMVNMIATYMDGSYFFWIYTALFLMFLEGMTQILTSKTAFYQTNKAESPTTDSPRLWLNLLCFLVPPVGLFCWLKLDNQHPRKARSAGRSAVRGVLVALIGFWVWNLSTQVEIAIKAIEYARLTPVDAEKVAKSIQKKKLARQKIQ